MKIVFSSRPAYGHVFSLMPLAEAARAAGHEVVFATGEDFLPRVESWGFVPAKVGASIESGFQETAARYPELLNPEQPAFGGAMFVETLGPKSLRDMAAVLNDVRPDVVVYEATDVGSAVAAAAAGVPTVCHSITMSIASFDEAILERADVLWKQVGAEPSVDLTAGDIFLDIWPRSMQDPKAGSNADTRWPLRPVPWGDPASGFPAWLGEAEGPLVYVSLGTVFWGKELLAKVIEGLSDLEVDALVLAGVDATPDDLPTRSPRVRVTGFVKQPEVLRHADVVVDHGGAGTLLGSLAHGLPQLVLAAGADRPYTAESLTRSGAGIKLEPGSATAESIAGAIRRLLDDGSYRARAEELRDEIAAMPSPADVIRRLEAAYA